MVLNPNVPKRLDPPIPAIPNVSVLSMIGKTIILIKRIKISPAGWKILTIENW